jgi:lysophospholipase L1-like esterase
MSDSKRPSHLYLLLALFAVALVAAGAGPQDDERPVVTDPNFQKEKAEHPTLPTIFFVGDSTMNSSGKAAFGEMRGWASEVGAYFDKAKINVLNRGRGGRSSRTYRNEGLWDKVLAEAKPGDFFVIEFGTNDVGRWNDPGSKYRPSLHGEGEESEDFVKPGPDGAASSDMPHETVHTFGWYMRQYATDAKAKGCTVILCSMVPHKRWKGDKVARGEQETFVPWTAHAAQTAGVFFVDLDNIVADGYDQLGPEKVEAFFADKGTHTTAAGAKFTAEHFIAGAKALSGNPLGQYLSTSAEGIQQIALPVR